MFLIDGDWIYLLYLKRYSYWYWDFFLVITGNVSLESFVHMDPQYCIGRPGTTSQGVCRTSIFNISERTVPCAVNGALESHSPNLSNRISTNYVFTCFKSYIFYAILALPSNLRTLLYQLPSSVVSIFIAKTWRGLVL